MKIKPLARSVSQLDPVLHCPKCWRYRTHWRRLEGGLVIYKCMVCKHEQRYVNKPLEVDA
jgi:hypothetical protein